MRWESDRPKVKIEKSEVSDHIKMIGGMSYSEFNTWLAESDRGEEMHHVMWSICRLFFKYKNKFL